MACHMTPPCHPVLTEHRNASYFHARAVEPPAKRKTLEEPGAFDTLTASLNHVVLAQARPTKAKVVLSPRCASLTGSPPSDFPQKAPDDRPLPRAIETGPRASTLPSATPMVGSLPQPSSAPIYIRGRAGADTYGRQRDSFALASPQSVSMVRSTSNGLSSQPTSYAPSQFMPCDYSECGSFKPNLDGFLGSPLSRRISIDQAAQPRVQLLRDHLSQFSRAPSTERKAQLDAWRCADMDPPNGAREDGTEHFAFYTDEELQAAQAGESYSPLPVSLGFRTPRSPD